ncbi:unnamed protein product [Phytomonas sp. EM1]|nr:unnamed protein product [Phytomonas sp. EM1]|eukprot:CCW61819.1 unnamed protein product [Phytomonas sp. isolate EM1]
MPINVFLAYVDTYIGRQLLRQFEHKPTLFSVYGCVWDNDNITNLTEQHNLLAADDRVSICSDPVKRRSSDHARHKPEIEQLETSMPERDTFPTTMVSCRFFWRRDGAAVQKALRECEWIVIEQREAQDVFDILHILQSHQGRSHASEALCSSDKFTNSSFFQKPKKFVLLSNFMSWFATPPLHRLSSSHKVDTDNTQDEKNDDSDIRLEDDDEDMEIDAPYPPPLEEDRASLLAENDENNNEEEDQNDGLEFDKMAGKKDILTEDQYNRRIPHIKYFNWRDAEKAVAAAHRANGLPLDTFVIFAGLAYGEGEDILEPFFRQAWNATMEKQSGEHNHTLPIFGTGDQLIPMIHVKDLATFTRKLLCSPSQILHSQRYIFATDSDTQLSWSTIVKAINQAFGGACALQMVKPAENPLYNNIEHFTIDLCLERGAIKTIMEMEEDALIMKGGARLKFDANAQYLNEVMNNETKEMDSWVSEGGFKQNIEKISLEFRVERNVTPKRVLVLGPPLSGKSYLAAMLARYYKIPVFRIEDVVEAFREHLRECKKKLEDYRTELIRGEEERRLSIKTSRIRRAARLRKRKAMLAEQQQTAGEEGGQETEEEGRDIAQKSGKQQLAYATGGKDVQYGHAYGTGGATDDDDGENDLAPPCTLSLEELKEVEQVIEEKIANSPLVERWRSKIAEMERILLMKVRLSTMGAADDLANAATTSKRATNKSSLSKKRLAKEQQRKKEEEELQQAKEALQDAPFQDQGLALMLRWRLAWPDCRNQGYILVGFPQNLQQARYSFGCEPLIAPATEDEALNPRSTAPAQSSDTNNESEEAADDQHVPRNQELSDEGRLPDDVLILCADDEYLLKRWNALSGLKAFNPFTETCSGDNPITGNSGVLPPNDSGMEVSAIWKKNTMPSCLMLTGESKKKTLEAFNEELEGFKRRFGTTYDASVTSRKRSGSVVTLKSVNGQSHNMLNYLECAVTVSTGITSGGRRIRIHQVSVQKEPLIPPPAPSSKYELPPASALELTAQQKLGPPHYFGKTPLEVHQETVRRVRLEEERISEKKRLEQEARNREQEAYEEELITRESANNDLLAIQTADYAALEERKAPLRKFLMKQVMPLLSKGLVEVCERRPENPTEYLAEWLLRHNPHDEIFSDL